MTRRPEPASLTDRPFWCVQPRTGATELLCQQSERPLDLESAQKRLPKEIDHLDVQIGAWYAIATPARDRPEGNRVRRANEQVHPELAGV